MAFTLAAVGLIHRMVVREEQYLTHVHKEAYHCYKERTPRYFLL